MSRYSLLVDQWKDCKRCPLHERRHNVVMARGRVPCDVVFVGEAPGQSEDVCGKPFIGPAGHLLDTIIGEAFTGSSATHAFFNLVGCIPKQEDGDKVGEPPDESVKACRPRLEGFVSVCNPKLVVCVGKMSEEWCNHQYRHAAKLMTPDGNPIERISITHPAAILRALYASRPLLIKRCVVNLQSGLRSVGL